jgi:HD-like signal output (HDOD) protein
MTIANNTHPPILQRLMASLNEFPMARAAVIPVVMDLTSNPNTTPGDLSRAISTDPALSAAVLRLSNSSFYGRVKAVSTLKEAVMVLGVSLLRSLIIATSVSSLFKVDDDELEDTLWRHSLATAIGSRLIARHIGARQIEEEVFLAGLVQDLSQLLMLQRFPEEYRPVLIAMGQCWNDQQETERSQLGITHEELSAVILEEWNFPTRLVEVVRHHHDPDALDDQPDGGPNETVRRMRHIVCMADMLATSLGHGFADSSDLSLVAMPSVDYLEIAADVIPQISEEMLAHFAEEQELFKA